MFRFFKPIAATGILTFAAGALHAQASFIEGSVTGTWNSPFPTGVGTRHREFGFAGIRAGWKLKEKDTRSLYYWVEVVPFAIMTHDPIAFHAEWCTPNWWDGCLRLVPDDQTIQAAGITPVGLRAHRKMTNRLSLSADAAGGTLIFTHPVPDPEARRFNFTASAGTSLELRVTGGTAVSLGYLWHHTSNGGTAKANPGLNSHMIRVALVRNR